MPRTNANSSETSSRGGELPHCREPKAMSWCCWRSSSNGLGVGCPLAVSRIPSFFCSASSRGAKIWRWVPSNTGPSGPPFATPSRSSPGNEVMMSGALGPFLRRQDRASGTTLSVPCLHFGSKSYQINHPHSFYRKTFTPSGRRPRVVGYFSLPYPLGFIIDDHQLSLLDRFLFSSYSDVSTMALPTPGRLKRLPPCTY